MGILENEAVANKAFLIIESRVGEIGKAFGIDEDACAKFLDDVVAAARLSLEPHGVGKSRTAASADADAQPTGLGRNALLDEQFADFHSCFFCYVNWHRR